jgi:hypothetical protein
MLAPRKMVLVNVKAKRTHVYHSGPDCCPMTRLYPQDYQPKSLIAAQLQGLRACGREDSRS